MEETGIIENLYSKHDKIVLEEISKAETYYAVFDIGCKHLLGIEEVSAAEYLLSQHDIEGALQVFADMFYDIDGVDGAIKEMRNVLQARTEAAVLLYDPDVVIEGGSIKERTNNKLKISVRDNMLSANERQKRLQKIQQAFSRGFPDDFPEGAIRMLKNGPLMIDSTKIASKLKNFLDPICATHEKLQGMTLH